MTHEQTLYLNIGESLCALFGAHYSSDPAYQRTMEGCFTQDAQTMVKGLEQFNSRHASTIPLFLRGRLFQLAKSLRKGRLTAALSYAQKARKYGCSLGVSSFKPSAA
tara:strand:+ start:314 stop:634 length:321 start_codon:yes stop_codon:yes gene_type:complete